MASNDVIEHLELLELKTTRKSILRLLSRTLRFVVFVPGSISDINPDTN